MDLRRDDLSSSQTQALLRFHFENMRATSPPGQAFVLDLSGLRDPKVQIWSLWEGEAIAGIAALKRIDTVSGEVKSMRTHPRFLRRGVASSLLEHLIEWARMQHWRTLSLETGSGPAFEPAVALYLKHGFVQGPPFADYQASEFNQFFHLALD